jgi:hypothetical protein
MSAADDEKAKKAEKKAKLKAEAEKLGITYEELKKQKKEKKESKRKREADQLGGDDEGRQQEKKRMRTWSGDFGDGEKKTETKRARTRSMDKAEENAKIVQEEKSQSPEEWRKSHNITIRGYGKRANEEVADPFIEFDDAPFNPAIQKTLKAAGFERPTLIQSQVKKMCLYFFFTALRVCIYLTKHNMFTILVYRPGRSPCKEQI